jgi:hypothetical protein
MRLDGTLLRSSFTLNIPTAIPENEDIIDLFPALTSFFALVEGPDPVFYRITTSGSAVPEPASWAMLITGFGLTGAVLRRRRMATTRSETHS